MCEKGHVASRPIRHAMSGRSVRCPRLFPGNTEAGRGSRVKNPRGGNTEYCKAKANIATMGDIASLTSCPSMCLL